MDIKKIMDVYLEPIKVGGDDIEFINFNYEEEKMYLSIKKEGKWKPVRVFHDGIRGKECAMCYSNVKNKDNKPTCSELNENMEELFEYLTTKTAVRVELLFV